MRKVKKKTLLREGLPARGTAWLHGKGNARVRAGTVWGTRACKGTASSLRGPHHEYRVTELWRERQ